MSIWPEVVKGPAIATYLCMYVGEESKVYEELPKLPLPPLQATLDQYLDNLRSVRQ
jgi:hypothetical protein